MNLGPAWGHARTAARFRSRPAFPACSRVGDVHSGSMKAGSPQATGEGASAHRLGTQGHRHASLATKGRGVGPHPFSGLKDQAESKVTSAPARQGRLVLSESRVTDCDGKQTGGDLCAFRRSPAPLTGSDGSSRTDLRDLPILRAVSPGQLSEWRGADHPYRACPPACLAGRLARLRRGSRHPRHMRVM